jgi:hypothetical protein
MLINVGNHGYREGVDNSREEFFGKLPGWEVVPTTADFILLEVGFIYGD